MRRRAPFVGVLLAGLVLAACGGGGEGSTASTAGTTAAPATTSAAPATSAAEPTTAPETTSGSTASTGTATEPNYASGSYRARRVAEFDRPVWVGSPPGDDRVFVVEPGAIRGRDERADPRRAEIGRGEAGHDVEDARELEDGKGVGVHGLSK